MAGNDFQFAYRAILADDRVQHNVALNAGLPRQTRDRSAVAEQ